MLMLTSGLELCNIIIIEELLGDMERLQRALAEDGRRPLPWTEVLTASVQVSCSCHVLELVCEGLARAQPAPSPPILWR